MTVILCYNTCKMSLHVSLHYQLHTCWNTSCSCRVDQIVCGYIKSNYISNSYILYPLIFQGWNETQNAHFSKFIRWAYNALHSLLKKLVKLIMWVIVTNYFPMRLLYLLLSPTIYGTKIYHNHCHSTLHVSFQIKCKISFNSAIFLRWAWCSILKMYM